METSISVEKRFPGCPRAHWLRNIMRQALKSAGAAATAELSLVITGQEMIHELNRQYLGEDRPTDVLSFPLLPEPAETHFPQPPDGKKHLGEIVISYPQAATQAQEHHHSVETELAILIIHGVLHLLGYDHEKAKERQEMRRRETEILGSLEGALK